MLTYSYIQDANQIDNVDQIQVAENQDANQMTLFFNERSVIVRPQSHDSSQQQPCENISYQSQNNQTQISFINHQLNISKNVQNVAPCVTQNALQQDGGCDDLNDVQITFNPNELMRYVDYSLATIDETDGLELNESHVTAPTPVVVNVAESKSKVKVVSQQGKVASKRKLSTDEPRNESTKKCRKNYKEVIKSFHTKIPANDNEISNLDKDMSIKKGYIAGQENFSPQYDDIEEKIQDSASLIIAKQNLAEARKFDFSDSSEERGQKQFLEGLKKGGVLAVPEGKWNVYYQKVLEKIHAAQVEVIKESRVELEKLSERAKNLHLLKKENTQNNLLADTWTF